MSLRLTLLLVALIALVALAGCGDDGGDGTTGSAAGTTTTGALAPLARQPAAPGEIVVSGEASPHVHGPYTFDGRYLVRFEQFAAEDPSLDFASQTPFTASLTRRPDDPRGAVKLFQAAARSGRRELAIHGRYYVDVSFGDYPYVIRFEPRRR